MRQHDHETFLPCHDHKIFRFHSYLPDRLAYASPLRLLGEGQTVTIREISVKSSYKARTPIQSDIGAHNLSADRASGLLFWRCPVKNQRRRGSPARGFSFPFS